MCFPVWYKVFNPFHLYYKYNICLISYVFGFYKMFNMFNCSIAWSVRKHGYTVFFKSYAFNLNPGFLAIAFNIKVKS